MSSMTWMHKVRLRVLALLVATTVAAISLVSFAALPVWPVIGVAVATIALVVNTMTAKMNQPVCWGCGKSIANQPSGGYGVICPSCGSLSQISRSGGQQADASSRRGR
jgi:predicted RNA-binding Zn-ribbon protein involved in translation (DUF1610 family)